MYVYPLSYPSNCTYVWLVCNKSSRLTVKFSALTKGELGIARLGLALFLLTSFYKIKYEMMT